jgi:hypothetical protein
MIFPMKRGPKEVDPGSLYAFAHQAYWGFRFLREHKKSLWKKVKSARTALQIRRIGIVCADPKTMRGAGYGAAGAMTWLENGNVAVQIIAAKHHRRYPNSNRPTSEDRRMIFLGIAVAAGVFGLSFNTALRKLAEAKLSLEHTIEEVHGIDRLHELIRSRGLVWAEPVGNYFWRTALGEWTLREDLPCEVPNDWQGGYVIYGYGPTGRFQATFSRTLPTELVENIGEDRQNQNDKININTKRACRLR